MEQKALQLDLRCLKEVSKWPRVMPFNTPSSYLFASIVMIAIFNEQTLFFYENGQRKGDLLYVLTAAFLRLEVSCFSWPLRKVLHDILTAPDYILAGL